MLWNPSHEAQSQGAARIAPVPPHESWRTVLRRCGVVVYAQETSVPYLEAHQLPEGNGVILGILFDRHQNRRLTADAVHKISKPADASIDTARRISREYWGGYLVILSNPHTGDWCVLRDSSGTIPCYYTTVRGITLVTSDARNLLHLTNCCDQRGALLSKEVNWQYLAGFLAYSQLQIRETALKSFSELLAGEALAERSDQRFLELVWDPATFIETDPYESLDARCESLRETVQACIDAWSGVHDWVVHSLSGGFDSSLVLAMLLRSRKRPNVVCINRYSNGPAEDERHYARAAARMAGIPLVEWPWDIGSRTLDMSCTALPLGAKPSMTALLSVLQASFYSALKAAHRFDAIWTGEGGDHLFLSSGTESVVADSLQIRGFRTGVHQVLRNTARLTGRSIPHLAWETVRNLIRGDSSHLESQICVNSLLPTSHPLHQDLEIYVRHPWSYAGNGAPPGKRRQIMLLAEVLNRLRPLRGTLESVALQPLLSQPIIEQCLRIPTYDLLCDSRTRGLARRAFATDIPAEILNRELKGQTTHQILGLLHRSSSFMSTLLTEGALAQQGLLDVAALKPLVAGTIPINAPQLFPLLACLAAEVWVRTWFDIHSGQPRLENSKRTVSHSTSP